MKRKPEVPSSQDAIDYEAEEIKETSLLLGLPKDILECIMSKLKAEDLEKVRYASKACKEYANKEWAKKANLVINGDNHEAIKGLNPQPFGGMTHLVLCGLSDEQIKNLFKDLTAEQKKGVQSINLYDCRKAITNTELEYLGEVKEIDLSNCDKVTDAGLAHLKGVEEINVRGCRKITDAGLAHLANAKVVNLSGCHKVTDAGLAHLANAEVVNVSGCKKITDAGLAHLANAEVVNVSGCTQITDAGLSYLKEVRSVDLSFCSKITDAGLAHLANAEVVNVSGCTQITDAGLSYLKEVRSVDLSFCSKITDAGVDDLIWRCQSTIKKVTFSREKGPLVTLEGDSLKEKINTLNEKRRMPPQEQGSVYSNMPRNTGEYRIL